MKSFLLMTCLPTVLAQSDEESAYYFTTWIFLSFMLLFYIIIASMTFPYARPRVPLFLFFVLIFLPPAFFILLFYLLIVFWLSTPVVVVQEAEPVTNTKGVPKSRSELANRV